FSSLLLSPIRNLQPPRTSTHLSRSTSECESYTPQILPLEHLPRLSALYTVSQTSNPSTCRTKDITTKAHRNNSTHHRRTNKAVILSKVSLLSRLATNRALQCNNSRCNTNRHPHHNRKAAHVVEDVSVSVSLHCAAAVSAKRAAKLALIVPSAAKDAVKHETNYTTPNTTARS
ncbi:hypothetical protein DL95DRAFT_444865, partial [Leptodontidium sp. 2 PMI_412]